MSDTHHHGEHGDDHHDEGGGHEIDRMPNARLFNLLFGLSALTLLSCIGVIQLFNMQVEALETSRAEQGSFRIVEYTEQMNKLKSGWGKLEVKELDDKNTTTVRYYMPLANARKAMLEDANQLKALQAPPGWKTADELAPPPAAKPTAPPDGPGMRPGAPAVPTTDGGAKPEGEKPSGEKPEGEPPADDAKAEPAKKPRPPKPTKPPEPSPAPGAADAG